ncbi:MAG: 16S rRNA (guanine(966)-N(2))-methyltransferase RsmD [Ruminococcaceae bacterium]|nr:16S rRNA (guanine(966)-N(2))-methyltransferase RsmD [Oscillospiraceae bacterium]
MRIITGSARGIALDTLEGENTRPTADRAKEALFSMIQFDIEGRRCLDLFAGSGQLGLEAISRGAEHCVFIDEARDAVDIVLANAKKTKLFDRCRISSGNFSQYLKNAAGREAFDLIFLDPPYASGYIAEALELICSGGLLRAGGRIVCESDNGTAPVKKKDIKNGEYHKEKVMEQVFGGDAELMERYTVVKTALYGRSRITLLEEKKEAEE